jgi:hypothetical protein
VTRFVQVCLSGLLFTDIVQALRARMREESNALIFSKVVSSYYFSLIVNSSNSSLLIDIRQVTAGEQPG